MHKSEWQNRIDLMRDSKFWPHIQAGRMADLLGAPTEMCTAILTAEIEVMRAARAQREAVDAVEQWLRQQCDAEIKQ